MRIQTATIVDHRELYGDTFLTWFQVDGPSSVPSAGQFVMVHCSDDSEPLFARAFSYHRIRTLGGRRQAAILYTVTGAGTSWLARRSIGDSLRIYGPLGHGLILRPGARSLLLVGGGIGVAPLVDFAERMVGQGREVVLFHGARNAGQLFPASDLPEEVEYQVATEDGSAGFQGLVTDAALQHLAWADQVFACGPVPMFRSLRNAIRASGRRRLSAQVLMEENMPCGWGMCYGCAVETRHGPKLVCKDGPRFNLFDLELPS
jgi:dihydroorotate dehydrogenase electron transfer subunit